MNITSFEKLVVKHSLCPKQKLYNSNALAGEAGEVANLMKKIRIATIRPDWVADNEESMGMPKIEDFVRSAREELGDVLFYLVRLGLDLGISMSMIMEMQADKLADQSEQYKRTFLK